jgi:uncharacterized protein
LARTGTVIASQADKAETLQARMVGLLGHSRLPDDEALIFEGCRSIHTFGMRFPIDVVFVDRSWVVVHLMPNLPPGRLPMPVWGGWGVLELAAGRIAKTGLQIGDQLVLREPLNGEKIVDSDG